MTKCIQIDDKKLAVVIGCTTGQVVKVAKEVKKLVGDKVNVVVDTTEEFITIK